ncbi:MAG TPA: hypothetical protein EYN32_04075 [Phycisphaerales bacterium]|nr:hypothetical protein [Phycisphaerales bacterium]
MNRKKGLALYELISANKPVGKPLGSERSNPEQEQDEHLERNVLTPGRSVRMSIGTIGVILAVSVALLVISYTMGFRRGSAIAREDYGNRLFEEVVTPAQTEVKNLNSSLKLPETPQKQPQAIAEPTVWGVVESDPRVKGSNYFTLIVTSKVGAMQLASFCREKGLETYAFSGDNTQFYRVIVLPGSVNRNDAVAKDVRSRIYAIGAEWAKTKIGRGSDLKDAYQSLYN